MSLIKCPECNGTVSDKASSCPHCGCPISPGIINENKCSYTVIMDSCGVNRAQAVHKLIEIKSIGMAEAHNIINNTPYVIVKNVSEDEANEIKKSFERIGSIITVKPYNAQDDECDHIVTNEVRCPRCGSNQITTGQRGYSLFTGFLGSSKTMNRCAKCGYSWQPK